MKSILVIIFQITFLLAGNSQVEPKKEIVFIDAKDPIPKYSFGDTIMIDLSEYIFINMDRSKNLYIVKREDKFGVIDKDCNFLIAPIISGSIKFESYGIKVIHEKHQGLYNFKGKELIPSQMRSIYSFFDGTIRYIDNNGKQDLYFPKSNYHTKFELCAIRGFSRENNLALISKDCINYGIINLDSIESDIDYVFQNPTPIYYDEFDGQSAWKLSKNGQFGVILENKEVLLPFYYDEVYNLNNNFIVKKNDQYGVVDADNKPLISIKYNSIKPLNSEDKFLVNFDGKFGVINLKEETVIPFDYRELKWESKKEVFEARLQFKRGIINKNNRVIIPFEFDHIEDNWVDGYIVSSNGKFGVISYKGEEIIPINFHQINILRAAPEYAELGYHVLNENIKSSFFDISGNQKTDFVFDEYEIHGTRQPIKVKIGETSFYVDAWGNCVKDCPSDSFLNQYGIKNK